MAMPEDLMRALALVLVIEGCMPLLSPTRFRISILRLASLEDKTLRILGVVFMLIGTLIFKLISS